MNDLRSLLEMATEEPGTLPAVLDSLKSSSDISHLPELLEREWVSSKRRAYVAARVVAAVPLEWPSSTALSMMKFVSDQKIGGAIGDAIEAVDAVAPEFRGYLREYLVAERPRWKREASLALITRIPDIAWSFPKEAVAALKSEALKGDYLVPGWSGATRASLDEDAKVLHLLEIAAEAFSDQVWARCAEATALRSLLRELVSANARFLCVPLMRSAVRSIRSVSAVRGDVDLGPIIYSGLSIWNRAMYSDVRCFAEEYTELVAQTSWPDSYRNVVNQIVQKMRAWVPERERGAGKISVWEQLASVRKHRCDSGVYEKT
jgi:hypothetical protein